MSEGGYKIRDQAGVYYLTFTVVNWIDVFTRQVYFDILAASINYCRAEKVIKQKIEYIHNLVSPLVAGDNLVQELVDFANNVHKSN